MAQLRVRSQTGEQQLSCRAVLFSRIPPLGSLLGWLELYGGRGIHPRGGLQPQGAGGEWLMLL